MAARQTVKRLTLLASKISFEVDDDSEEERVTYGKIWFESKWKAIGMALCLRSEPLEKVEVWVMNRCYTFVGLRLSARKKTADSEDKYVELSFTSEDLVGVKDYRAPSKQIST